jgi:hypothetical protein
MTLKEIQACYERANAVLDGFKKPSEQNARDVVALLRHYNVVQGKSEDSKDFQTIKDLFGFK